MREILFRGKRRDNGAWETGSLVIVRGGILGEQVSIADKMTGYLTSVVAETVGQYTGLTDKNGKKIFEGDLLSDGHETDLVRWSCENFEYILDDGKVSYSIACIWPSSVEVIGNIYDNPELLGGADNATNRC